MSAKMQTGRTAWRDSSSRRVSVVEAAAVVESFLIEQNLVRTLSELRGEAASMLKGKRGQVKSLNKILHDYVVLREEHDTLKEENASLEQALKAEKMVNAQGSDNMRMLCRRIHDSIAQYEGGTVPLVGNPLPQLQPMPPFFFGHGTPPAMGIGPILPKTPGTGTLPPLANTPGTGLLPALANTPGTGTLPALANTPGTGILAALASTPGAEIPPALAKSPALVASSASGEPNNKRTIHSVPSNAGPAVTAPKKARQNSTPAAKPSSDAQGSPPWAMCGAVKKTSLNSVRTVPSKPSINPVTRPSRKASKKQHQHQQAPPSLPNPAPPLQLPMPPIASRSPLVKFNSLPSGPTSKVSALIDLSPPRKTSEGVTASHSDSEPVLPHSGPSTFRKPLASLTRHLNEGSQPQLAEGASKEVTKRVKSSKAVSSAGLVTQDQTSPDSRRCGSGARGLKPSKTMRPLNFSSGEKRTDEAPLAAAAPSTTSPLPSPARVSAQDPETPNDTNSRDSFLSASQETVSPDGSSMSVLGDDVFLEDDEQLCGDLAPIDDILAVLDETSFSDIYGHSITDGDCGHLPVGSCLDHISSQVGDDSLGIDGLFSKIIPPQPDPTRDANEKVLSTINFNSMEEFAVKRKPDSPMSKRAFAGPGVEAEKSRSIPDKENALVGAA